MKRNSFVFLFLLAACFAFTQSRKQPKPNKPAEQPVSQKPSAKIDEKLFGAMRWRQVGPFRGGRVLAVTGVPGEPNVFYFGGASSGVWKSSDAGANWQPIFDQENIASIGSIAVAPSDHNIIYVGPARPAFAATSLMATGFTN